MITYGEKKVTTFLKEYVDVNPKYDIDDIDVFSDKMIKDSIKLLLENAVFIYPQKLRVSILKSQGAILPWDFLITHNKSITSYIVKSLEAE